ncbi:hypothetical protein EON62_04265, partial [archaeon]
MPRYFPHVCVRVRVPLLCAPVQAFTIFNGGALAPAISIDRTTIFSSNFALEPSRLQRLPEQTSHDIDVAFDARSVKGREVPLGTYSATVQVRVAKGPAINVTLRVNVTVPDVRITPDVLDFESVVVGQEKDVCLQLHNVTPVPVAWSIPPALPSTTSRDRDFFKVEPISGSLQPGERCMLTVSFTPAERRAYSVSIPLRLANNPKQRNIVVKGNGEVLDVRFEAQPLAAPSSAAAGSELAPVPGGTAAVEC